MGGYNYKKALVEAIGIKKGGSMIKKLINFYKKKIKIINDFSIISDYLAPGEYRFDRTLTYIYLNDDYVRKRVSYMFDNRYLNSAYYRPIFKVMFTLFLKVAFVTK